MRLPMAHDMTESDRTQDAISRALRIARRMAMGDDLRVRAKIESFQPEADYEDIQSLCIAEDALELIIEAGIDPKMVFAHPDILVKSHNLFADPEGENSPPKWHLIDGVVMTFGSEPDIAFTRDKKFAVLIEIKGGKDPAGALERLGAIKKTFDEAPADCKNFLILGVDTPTMRTRLNEMRIEADFNINQLLESSAAWTEFVNEIFHHAQRIAPEEVDSDS